MKVTKDKTESSQAYLTIEMEPTEVEESLAEAYQRLVKRVNIPGFRKGKAPRLILERHVGKEHLLEEALDKLIPEACGKAIKEQGLEPIAQPRIELTQTEPVVFKAVVSLRPQVKVGDYRNIKVAPVPVEEVTEANIDAVIEELRHQHATWEPVERPADFGDIVVLDVEGTADGKQVLDQKGVSYGIVRESPSPAPGFSEQIVGLKKGEVKDFKLQMPSDYRNSELAGKEVSFKVTAGEVKQEKLPEITDEFAGTIGDGFQTVAALRERIMADMRKGAEERARLDYEDKVLEAAASIAEVEFPPVLVEAEVNELLNQRFQQGRPEMEGYLRAVNKTEDELRQEIQPVAVTRITRSLVIGKVAEEEKIEVSDAEIDGEIENMTKNTTEKREQVLRILNTPQTRESIGARLRTRRTIERLVEIARGPVETGTEQKEEAKK